MNASGRALPATGRISSAIAAGKPTCPLRLDVFAKAREHERLAQLQAARELDALPYFRVLEGPTLPVVEMEGKRADHARLQQLPRADRRRARQAGRARRAQPLRHRASPARASSTARSTLHLELERELAEWLGTEAAIVFTTGHQANLGALGTILGPRRHRRRRLRRPRVDPRRLHPLARQAARRSATTASTCSSSTLEKAARRTAAASWSSSTACSRWRATSRRCPRSPSCARGSARG